MPYTRLAIEKYIYNKLNDHLLAMYMFKLNESNFKFQARQQELKNQYTKKYDKYPLEFIYGMMGELDIKLKLRLNCLPDNNQDQEESKSPIN